MSTSGSHDHSTSIITDSGASLPLLLDAGEQLRLIEDNVRDYAIIVLDADGRIINWNVGAERILQWPETEVLGKDCAVIFTPEDRAEHADRQELAKADSAGRTEDERWHLKQDGSRFYASGIMTALHDEGKTLRGYVKILRDATERKRLERLAQEDRRAAEAAVEALREVNARLELAMVETHHRVKNSLNLIAGLMEIRAAESPEVIPVSALKELGVHVRSLASLHDLLTQQVKREGTTTNLLLASDVLAKLIPLLQATAPTRRITFQMEDVALSTRQASSLSLIINEVVSNALKHSQSGVNVVFRVAEGMAELEVSDDGKGFPENFDSSISSNTGLELIEQLTRYDLSGTVEYANKPEGGACIHIRFPVQTTIPPN